LGSCPGGVAGAIWKQKEKIMLRPVRRIVTTNNAEGRSRVLFDGAASNTITVLTELWQTDRTPTSNEGEADNALKSDRLHPPKNGTVFRYFEIGPESETSHLPKEERYRLAAEWFEGMGGADLLVDTRRHPAMHKSATTDYIILLSGEITLMLDDGEVDLKPLDVVVQRGTNHAWVNKGTQNALLMAVLIDAHPSKV
jgi:mannose-6-phosphate isomerase-like protein (cupin superfamily)